MYQKLGILSLCVLLGACVSEQERRESMYRYEQTMRNQCEHTLGFATGTQNYMNCRLFYDEYLAAIGYPTGSMSFSKADAIQSRINALNTKCTRYWGTQGLGGQNLWYCVRQLGDKQIEQAKHEQELQEQEEMLTRSIAAGQKEANDDNRLQARIEAERERVAKEKGKNPKKVKCSTYTKSNGYVQVKCK